MSQTMHVRAEVAGFVAEVRDRLGDLTEEEREELVGGLEADLTDLLADGGSVDGLDPAAYAAELRAAAGLEERRRTRGRRRPLRAGIADTLDRWHRRFDGAVGAGATAPLWDFVVVLRPLWWFFRAWLAAQLLDVAYGHDLPTPVPTLLGVWPGVLVTALFTVVSVQVGRGRWWPGSRAGRSVPARSVLLVLNLFAVVLAPLVLGQFPASGSYEPVDSYVRPASGLQERGEFVANVFPYDAKGRPLRGVQLFDQDGRPLSVGASARGPWAIGGRLGRTTYPWYNGGARLWNVFPLPTRDQGERYSRPRSAWRSTNPPSLPAPPLAVVPPAAVPSAGPSASPSASP